MVSSTLFFILLALLPTQLGLHFWPEWSMVLGRRIDYLSPTLYLTDIFVFLIITAWFLQSISNIKYQISNIQIKNQKLLIFFLILLYAIINNLFAISRPSAVYNWLKILEFGLLGFYIIKTKPGLSLIAAGLSIGVVYSSIIAISQFILQHSVGGPLWWLGERTFNVNTPGIARINLCSPFSESCQLLLRPYATFPHPNVLAGFLAVTIPLIIAELSHNLTNKLSKIKKIFYLGSITMGVIVLILSFGKSGLTIGALGIIITAWITVRSNIFKKFWLITGIILIILTLFQLRNVSLSEESLVVREQLNSAAVKLWTLSPIFGIGLGNFLVKLPQILPSRTIYFLQPVHNIYLLILAETGILGLSVFIWLILLIIKKYEFRIMNYEKYKNFSRFIIHTSLFLILLLGFVDHYTLDLQQGQLLLTLLLALSFTN